MKKTAAAIMVLAALFLLACASGAVLYSRLDAEKLAHNATRAGYARDKALWLSDQRQSNATVRGLQRQVNATLAGCREDREAEERRFAIFANATLAVEPQGVVDEQTNKAAVRHLNGAFDRLCGLRGQGAARD